MRSDVGFGAPEIEDLVTQDNEQDIDNLKNPHSSSSAFQRDGTQILP